MFHSCLCWGRLIKCEMEAKGCSVSVKVGKWAEGAYLLDLIDLQHSSTTAAGEQQDGRGKHKDTKTQRREKQECREEWGLNEWEETLMSTNNSGKIKRTENSTNKKKARCGNFCCLWGEPWYRTAIVSATEAKRSKGMHSHVEMLTRKVSVRERKIGFTLLAFILFIYSHCFSYWNIGWINSTGTETQVIIKSLSSAHVTRRPRVFPRLPEGFSQCAGSRRLTFVTWGGLWP